MTGFVARQRPHERGFTLIETLIALALMGLVLSALANLTAQWLPNWNRGFERIQRSELIGIALQRIGADLASAEYVTANRGERHPLFDGSELSVTFVRTALGPNAGSGLDVVRLGETSDSLGFATVRSRAPFRPSPVGSSRSEQLQFGEPVLLLRSPYRLSFAYAGQDRVWKSSWHDAEKLPAVIKLTVRDAASERVLLVSTVTPVHVQSAARGDCTQPNGKCDGKPGDPNGAQPGSQGNPGENSQQTGGAAVGQGGARGFVIVAVLWILVALSALATIFSLYLSNSAQALAVGDDGLQAEALVSASVELTAYQLLLANDKARPPRGSFRFHLDHAEALVTYTSETARIDLNRAPKEMLSNLFEVMGAEEKIAREAADRIVGWRTPPKANAANEEAALYAASGLVYSPRQSPFAHVNELSLVLGIPAELIDRALPFMTVFSGSADVDVLIAPAEIIAALPGMTPAALTDFLNQRTGLPRDQSAVAAALGSTKTKASIPQSKSFEY